MDAHGGVLTAFWGSWGPKRCGLACGELGQEPLASFWRGFWVYDPGRFLVIMTWRVFGPGAHGEVLGTFVGVWEAWKPKS